MNLCIILWTWKLYFYINSGKTDMFIIHSFCPRIMCIFYLFRSSSKSLKRVFRFLWTGSAYFVSPELYFSMTVIIWSMWWWSALLPFCLLCVLHFIVPPLYHFPMYLAPYFLGFPLLVLLLVLAQKENTFHGGEAELEVGCFSLSISFL